MRYGIISDIHSNLEALRRVLSGLGEKKVDCCLCAGDIVGYGADPAECIRLVRDNCSAAVCGNHDYGIFDDEVLDWFNPEAREAILWTREQLSEDEVEFLKGLEMKKPMDDFMLVHSTALFPKEWKYIVTVDEAADSFEGFDEKICFIGHSHKPMIFTFNEKNSECRFGSEPLTLIVPHLRYIINVGSVGQPRDGDPRAAFAVFDTVKREVEICRVDYDVKSAGEKIIKAGLPEALGVRLGFGS